MGGGNNCRMLTTVKAHLNNVKSSIGDFHKRLQDETSTRDFNERLQHEISLACRCRRPADGT